MLADVDGAAAERAATEIGGDALGRRSTSPTRLRSRHSSATSSSGTALEVLINNAGTAAIGATQERVVDHWTRIIDVNLKGVAHGVSAAYGRMIARGWPRP